MKTAIAAGLLSGPIGWGLLAGAVFVGLATTGIAWAIKKWA